jgi:hypothetical protein
MSEAWQDLETELISAILSSRPSQPLLSPGDTILIVRGYPGLLAPYLQYYLPASIIAITNKESVEQITEGVFYVNGSI